MYVVSAQTQLCQRSAPPAQSSPVHQRPSLIAPPFTICVQGLTHYTSTAGARKPWMPLHEADCGGRSIAARRWTSSFTRWVANKPSPAIATLRGNSRCGGCAGFAEPLIR